MSESSFENRELRVPSGITVSRRTFLYRTAAPLAGIALAKLVLTKSVAAKALASRDPKMVAIVEFSDAGQREQKVSVAFITKTDEEWRKQLSPLAFAVTR